MVDEDKKACCRIVEEGYCVGLWPEAYLRWDFLEDYPKAMEPGYLNLNWNHIPGMYCQKQYT